MTGQIPPYGKYFRREGLRGYSRQYSSTRYVLKADARYYIQSDHTSKKWFLFCGDQPFAQRGSMTLAMKLMRSVTAVPMQEWNPKGLAWQDEPAHAVPTRWDSETGYAYQ